MIWFAAKWFNMTISASHRYVYTDVCCKGSLYISKLQAQIIECVIPNAQMIIHKVSVYLYLSWCVFVSRLIMNAFKLTTTGLCSPSYKQSHTQGSRSYRLEFEWQFSLILWLTFVSDVQTVLLVHYITKRRLVSGTVSFTNRIPVSQYVYGGNVTVWSLLDNTWSHL